MPKKLKKMKKGLPIIRFSHSVLLQTQPQSCTTEDFIFIVPMTRMPHPASPLTTSRI